MCTKAPDSRVYSLHNPHIMGHCLNRVFFLCEHQHETTYQLARLAHRPVIAWSLTLAGCHKKVLGLCIHENLSVFIRHHLTYETRFLLSFTLQVIPLYYKRLTTYASALSFLMFSYKIYSTAKTLDKLIKRFTALSIVNLEWYKAKA